MTQPDTFQVDTSPARPLAPRADLALLRIDGGDAETFLQGQVTCDVATLPQGCWTWGGHCTAKGRLIAVFRLARSGPGFVIELPAVQAEALAARLRRYVLRSKVTLTGAGTGALQFRGATHDLPAALARPALDHQFLETDAGCTFAEGPDAGVFHPAAATPARAESADLRRDIEAGLPWLTPATEDQFVPQMVDLDRLGGISFTKGCYPGQEIVARTRYLGTVKRRLHRLATDRAVPPGTAIETQDAAPRSVGTVLACAPAPDGAGCEALAVLEIEAAAGPLRLADGGSIARVQPSHPEA